MRIRPTALCAAAAIVVACGGTPPDITPTAPATPDASPSAAVTLTPLRTVTVAPGVTPGSSASATPAPAADTGIDGLVTVGPTCPVERPESPCPDRPLAARITIWRGDTKLAETRSGEDGRFRVILPPGTYRVVGETEGTFPRGSEVEATVVQGRLTSVQIQYDSGIR